MKTCRSLRRKTILKIPSIAFERTYALSSDFKRALSGKVFR